MLAVLVVRDGVLPSGGLECVSECRGRVLAIGSGTTVAAEVMRGVATDVRLLELGAFQPGAYAQTLRPVLQDESRVILPASADGRDLAAQAPAPTPTLSG